MKTLRTYAVICLIMLNGAVLFAQIAPAANPDGVEGYDSLDSLFTLYQPYLGNISAYKPIYFLAGLDPEESKFQISFKYRFLNPEGPLAIRHPWLNGFHMAYTQTSFWDLKSDSQPFEDTSYKPELFYQSSHIGGLMPDYGRFFIQTGFLHESNGKGGDASRSTNFLYFDPILIFYDEISRLGLQISPRVWCYVFNDDESNPDLDAYRGYFELGAKIGKAERLVLESRLRYAEKGGSILLDLTCPLHRSIFSNLQLYLHVQYANTLAESLKGYNERNEAVRIGFSIVR